MRLKISVITAVYNSESTISDSLKSISAQTFGSIEHWIVDGNSSDSTLEVISKYPRGEQHVISEEDSGVYDAMNKGIRASTGDIIGFLNADDFYESDDVLQRVSSAFENPEIDIVYGNLCYVDSEDTQKVIRTWRSRPYRTGMFRRGWMPPHPTVYARRKVFEKVGLFDKSFSICADWEWLYRAFELSGYRTQYIDKHMVTMRMGGVSNRSASNILKSNREAVEAFRKHGKSVPLGFFPGKLIDRGVQFIQRGF